MWSAEVLVEGGFALRSFGHHIDAAAGRVHLFAPENVGRTGGKAEAAVDAVGEEFFRRGMMWVEGSGLGGFDLGEHVFGGYPPPPSYCAKSSQDWG